MNDRFEKIEAFIRGKLSPKEHIAFQDEIKEDQDLAMEVEIQRLEWEAIHLIREDDLRNKFKSWQEEPDQEYPQESHTKIKNSKSENLIRRKFSLFRITAAASVLLILGFLGLYYKSTQYSNTALYKQYYKTPVIGSIFKNPGSSVNDILLSGKNSFEQKEYSKTIDFFKQVPKDNPNFHKAQLFIAHSYLLKSDYGNNIDELTTAIAQYQQVIATSDNQELLDKAEWYLILAQLKADNSDDQLIQMLEKISLNKDHDHVNDANKLLQNINSLWHRGIFYESL